MSAVRPSRPSRAARPAAKAPHQVRIIGGQWKRTPLAVLDAEGLRPTPDRVRETLFNWLTHLLPRPWEKAACLDLFAGTGALGFEAASRGAAKVMMVESNSGAARQLEATKTKLKAEQVTIRRGDALAVARQLAALAAAAEGEGEGKGEGRDETGTGLRFDLVFLDPPYHQDWLVKTLPLCQQLLVEGGLVYAEAEVPLTVDAPDWLADWDVVRADKAGMVFYHLLQCKAKPQNQA
jgi:16S rRNA (guanine966-N2)-methyltransferase